MAGILLGSMPFISHINPVLTVARRLVEEDVLVVVTTGGRPASSIKIDPLPDNVRVETFIPYNKLMPHVSVMLTNGRYAERRRRANGNSRAPGKIARDAAALVTRRSAWRRRSSSAAVPHVGGPCCASSPNFGSGRARRVSAPVRVGVSGRYGRAPATGSRPVQ